MLPDIYIVPVAWGTTRREERGQLSSPSLYCKVEEREANALPQAVLGCVDSETSPADCALRIDLYRYDSLARWRAIWCASHLPAPPLTSSRTTSTAECASRSKSPSSDPIHIHQESLYVVLRVGSLFYPLASCSYLLV